jgi:hypothetical protein
MADLRLAASAHVCHGLTARTSCFPSFSPPFSREGGQGRMGLAPYVVTFAVQACCCQIGRCLASAMGFPSLWFFWMQLPPYGAMFCLVGKGGWIRELGLMGKKHEAGEVNERTGESSSDQLLRYLGGFPARQIRRTQLTPCFSPFCLPFPGDTRTGLSAMQGGGT